MRRYLIELRKYAQAEVSVTYSSARFMVLLGAPICAPIPTVPATPVAAQCVGDCNGDAEVAINKLISCVNIALANAEVPTYPEFDQNEEAQFGIDLCCNFIAEGEQVFGLTLKDIHPTC